MRCVNHCCNAELTSEHKYCYACGLPRPRSLSSATSEEEVIEQFLQHQQERSRERSNHMHGKRPRILSPAPQTIQMFVWAASRDRLSGQITRKNATRRVLPDLTTSHSLQQLFEKAKCILTEIVPELSQSDFEDMLTSEHQSMSQFDGITPASTVMELKNKRGVVYSKMKFYLCYDVGGSLSLSTSTMRNQEGATTNTVYVSNIQPSTSTVTATVTRSVTEDNLNSSNSVATNDNQNFLVDSLTVWKDETIQDGTCPISVLRHALLRTLRQVMKETEVSFLKLPKINFIGEVAVDQGGPRREFFRLLLGDITNHSGILQLTGDGMIFTHNVDYVQSGRYQEAGRLVGWSILHGGSGLHALSHKCLALLRGETPNLSSWVGVVMDEKTKRVLKLVIDTTNDSWTEVLDTLADELEGDGFPLVATWQYQEKNNHINSILIQYFYYRNVKAFEDFKFGLNSVGGLWNRIAPFHEIQEQLLGYSNKKLTAAEFEGLLDYQFSEHGSNAYRFEQETVFCMFMFLSKLEAGIPSISMELTEGEQNENDETDFNSEMFQGELTLSTFLALLTGASIIPPFGLNQKIVVRFFDKKENVKKFPQISTCGLDIELPRGYSDVTEFVKYMEISIRGARDTFGKL